MEKTTEDMTITDLLEQIGGGELVAGATAKLRKLVTTMQESARNSGGKPTGKVTIGIKLKLDRGTFEVDGDVKVSEPSTIHARTILWGTKDGQLLREDPRQGSLALAAGPDDGDGRVRSINRK